MAEFDLDKMAHRVAEKALDEFTYNGKTIREWVELMVTVESVVEVRMVEELEKVKTEMNVELFKEYSAEREFDNGYESCLKQQINRIDKHIAELKGENK